MDDDEPIRRFLSLALFDEGYEVVTASNGAIAMERAREHPPDVILLDMNMPILDGWEFSARYRDMGGQHAAIVVMTAAASAQARAEQLGAEDFLGKPFDLTDLFRVVERHLPGGPGGNRSKGDTSKPSRHAA